MTETLNLQKRDNQVDEFAYKEWQKDDQLKESCRQEYRKIERKDDLEKPEKKSQVGGI